MGKKCPNFKLFYSVKGHFHWQKNFDRCFILWYWRGPHFETLFSFYPDFPWPLVSQIKSLLKSFASCNLPFRKNKPTKFQIWTLFVSSKQIDQFLGVWFGKHHSVLAQCLHDPLVSQNETPVKVFWFSQLEFQTKESNKMWNLQPFPQLDTNWPIFGGLIWKAASRFGPNSPRPFSVTKWNSSEGFLAQPIYLSDKRKQ